MRFYEMYFVRNDDIKMLNQSIINKTKRNKINGIFDYICPYVTTIKENPS